MSMSEPCKKLKAYQPWLVGVLAGVLYLLTLAPGVLWQDSGMFQVRVWLADLTGQLGLALSHPLYIVLCRAFTAVVPGDFAWRVNLFSGVCSAAAIGFIFASLRRLSRSAWPALLSVVLLAVSHTFWTHAVIAEVYGLYALLLAAEMYLLVRYQQSNGPGNQWWLVGLLFVNGLNVSNHLLALLHLPAYGIYALIQLRAKRIQLKHLIFMALAGMVGARLYVAMIIDEIVRGAGVIDTVRSALFGLHWQDRVIGQMPDAGGLAKCLGYFLLNFPTPLLLLGPVGIYLALRDKQTRSVAAIWFSICGVAFVFAMRYRVADQYVFFFPCYIFTAVFVGLAVDHIGQLRPMMGRSVGKIIVLGLAVLPVLVYELGPSAVGEIPSLKRVADKALRIERAIGGRDSYTYFLRPRKNGQASAGEFCLAALRLAKPNGLIVAGDTVRNPMIYLQQVEGQYPDVYLPKGADLQAIREVPADLATVAGWLASGRRVFIVSSVRQRSLVDQLEADGRFRLVAKDPLYEVEYVEKAID